MLNCLCRQTVNLAVAHNFQRFGDSTISKGQYSHNNKPNTFEANFSPRDGFEGLHEEDLGECQEDMTLTPDTFRVIGRTKVGRTETFILSYSSAT